MILLREYVNRCNSFSMKPFLLNNFTCTFVLQILQKTLGPYRTGSSERKKYMYIYKLMHLNSSECNEQQKYMNNKHQFYTDLIQEVYM